MTDRLGEGQTWYCSNENCGGHTGAGYCPVGEPPSPPLPSATLTPEMQRRAERVQKFTTPLPDEPAGGADPDYGLLPQPPSASGLLLTLKRAANLLDCGAALRTSECSPADPCAACLVHADVEAEIRKLEAPPPSEEPVYTGRRDPESPCPVCRELRPCGWCGDCDPEHFSDGVHAACFPVPSPEPTRDEPSR